MCVQVSVRVCVWVSFFIKYKKEEAENIANIVWVAKMETQK